MVNYKQRFNKTEKNRWSGLTISLCVVVVFYMLLSHIGSIKGFFNSFLAITSTVIIGAVIAYTVNPLAVFVYKRLKKAFKKNENAAWIISAVVSLGREHHELRDGTFRVYEQSQDARARVCLR